MAERRLKRELGLTQAVLLGTAGTIAASIFVLTGYAAGRMGPASILVILALGALNAAVALNYAELGTTYPVTGGALTYVREAYGDGLLSFLVGSLDSLSSSFYAALSAIGFAYSLQVLVPWTPIVPTALVVLGVFTLLNILGANYVGRAQMLLGGVLLGALATYVVVGLLSPTGFAWETFMPKGQFFVHEGVTANMVALFGVFALIYNAFVGFEIIADDAEEVQNPSRNVPLAIFLSLGLVTVIYVAILMVTMGTIPWFELANSERALTQAAEIMLPRWGAPLVALAGIIATLTSVNTALLSATREALTLGRAGLWPRLMSRLGKLRTPAIAALVVGGIAALVAAVGVVDFLSYISSAGYLFVVFWASIAMVRLHKLYPDIERPFKAPFFPLTAYMAAGTCMLAVAFASWQAQIFVGGLLALLTLFYYLRTPVAMALSKRAASAEASRDRLLVAVANPKTAEGLARLSAILSEERTGSPLEILAVAPTADAPPSMVERLTSRYTSQQNALLRRVARALQGRNVPYFTELRTAPDVVEGILAEIEQRGDVRLLLMGWPGRLSPAQAATHPVAELLEQAKTDMAVFLNRGVNRPARVLVPFGGGIHARLALRLATELVAAQKGEVVALRCYNGTASTCEMAVLDDHQVVDVAYEEAPEEEDGLHDELMLAREFIEAELGYVPQNVRVRVVAEGDIKAGVLAELARNQYDLVVMGAALAYVFDTGLFGSLTDELAEALPVSVLLVRRYESGAVNWVRRQVKGMVEAEGNGQGGEARPEPQA